MSTFKINDGDLCFDNNIATLIEATTAAELYIHSTPFGELDTIEVIQVSDTGIETLVRVFNPPSINWE